MTLHRRLGVVLVVAGTFALIALASFWQSVRPEPGMQHVDVYADPGTQITVTPESYTVFGGPRPWVVVTPGNRTMKDVFLGGVGVVAVTCGLILLVTGGRKQAEPGATAFRGSGSDSA